jgi:hypothetical protein
MVAVYPVPDTVTVYFLLIGEPEGNPPTMVFSIKTVMEVIPDPTFEKLIKLLGPSKV